MFGRSRVDDQIMKFLGQHVANQTKQLSINQHLIERLAALETRIRALEKSLSAPPAKDPSDP